MGGRDDAAGRADHAVCHAPGSGAYRRRLRAGRDRGGQPDGRAQGVSAPHVASGSRRLPLGVPHPVAPGAAPHQGQVHRVHHLHRAGHRVPGGLGPPGLHLRPPRLHCFLLLLCYRQQLLTACARHLGFVLRGARQPADRPRERHRARHLRDHIHHHQPLLRHAHLPRAAARGVRTHGAEGVQRVLPAIWSPAPPLPQAPRACRVARGRAQGAHRRGEPARARRLRTPHGRVLHRGPRRARGQCARSPAHRRGFPPRQPPVSGWQVPPQGSGFLCRRGRCDLRALAPGRLL
mmetsp:Transcript_12402/g.37132  ORF Transcript_12402/g.37132 Transcript_12402/m.37132 type:complete len:291 (-) Transcript_12402:3698-4570(-)